MRPRSLRVNAYDASYNSHKRTQVKFMWDGATWVARVLVSRSLASRGLLQTSTVSFKLERLPVDDRVTRSSPSTCPTAAPVACRDCSVYLARGSHLFKDRGFPRAPNLTYDHMYRGMRYTSGVRNKQRERVKKGK